MKKIILISISHFSYLSSKFLNVVKYLYVNNINEKSYKINRKRYHAFS